MLTLASALTFPGAADTERHTRIYINQCAAFINASLATLAAYHARIGGMAGVVVSFSFVWGVAASFFSLTITIIDMLLLLLLRLLAAVQ